MVQLLCVQSCLILCDPMDSSLPGSSVYEIFQARILEQVAISYSRGSSWPRDRTIISHSSCIGRQILYHWATWEALGFNPHVAVLITRASESELTQRLVFTEVAKLKWVHWEGFRSHMTGVLIKKGKFEDTRHTGRTPCENQARVLALAAHILKLEQYRED